MTREDRLISMNGAMLIGVADKLGVKVVCNRTRTALKEAKAKVVARILEAEAALVADDEEAPKQETLAKEEAPAKKKTKTAVPKADTSAQKKTEQPKAESPKATDTIASEAAMKMSETIKILEDLFDKLNVLYFERKLDKPVITVQSKSGRAKAIPSMKSISVPNLSTGRLKARLQRFFMKWYICIAWKMALLILARRDATITVNSEMSVKPETLQWNMIRQTATLIPLLLRFLCRN